MSDIKKIVEESFTRYAGNVILNRAICDVRDMLKPSARMLMYSQLNITKNIPSKPFIKSARVVGDALGHYYEHGDNSCYGTYMRMAKPFAMRYPLEDCQGNSGTINSTNDEASMRYTELRMNPLGYGLFEDIDKETVLEWSENFDETEKYPKIAPSKGYYNICNGTLGLGIAISSSIPQFNLKEINNSLIKLLWNPDIPFEEICVLPDFATGAIILNEKEVRESLKNGSGAAIKLRSVIEYNKNKRVLIVKELPYGVYTETISEQIQKLLEKNPNCGIDNVNDASHKVPDYEIYLSKNANPDKVLKLLYKETSLENYFSINMTVLVDGKKPAVLGLKEMLQAHLDHEKIVYQRGFSFDLKKINSRLHILEALIKAISMIDEVVKTIKQSADTKNASIALQRLLFIDETQAKAILDLKLSRLTHLDISKLEKEKGELETKKAQITSILSDETLLKKEIEKGLRDVAEKFGDARRTKILNLAQNEEETIEEKLLQISLSNQNNIYVNEASTLYTQKRGGVGNKLKISKGEFIINSISLKNTEEVLFFSREGKVFSIAANQLEIGESSLETYFELNKDTIVALSKIQKGSKTLSFFTARGLIKKSSIEEYKTKKKTGLKAIELRDGDKIISVLEDCNEVGLYTKKGYFIHITIDDVRAIGRVAQGVIAMKISADDEVIAAKSLDGAHELIFINENGLMKRTKIEEFPLQGRAGKGKKAHESSADFYARKDEREITIISSSSSIKISLDEIPLSSRDAMGVKSIKLGNDKKVTALI